jgi:hypothetical protein
MKIPIFGWSSVIAATLSSVWVLALTALVIRCKLADPPFPVLAKFSPFTNHLNFVDRMLRAFPVLALLALVLLGIACLHERSVRTVRGFLIAVVFCVLISLLVIVLNPGGYFSWFLS